MTDSLTLNITYIYFGLFILISILHVFTPFAAIKINLMLLCSPKKMYRYHRYRYVSILNIDADYNLCYRLRSLIILSTMETENLLVVYYTCFFLQNLYHNGHPYTRAAACVPGMVETRIEKFADFDLPKRVSPGTQQHTCSHLNNL